MDFGAVLEDLSSFLEERGFRWAVIGIRRYFERHGLEKNFDELEKTSG